MRITITPGEMKRAERAAIAGGAVTGEAMMERAAAHVAEAARRHTQGRPGAVLCLCGAGNNGGDGLAAMRLLAADEGFQGVCWVLHGPLSPDGAHQWARLAEEGPQVTIHRLADGELPPLPEPVSCVIDGLFGTGLSRPVTGTAARLCALANQLFQQGVPVIAVDIPSGLCGETGRVLGCALRATETVTFHRPKPGLYLNQGLNYSGKITVGDIGLPEAYDPAPGLSLLEREEIGRLLPPRQPVSHKGNYGRALLFAGSRGMAGAAAIAARAALRAGAGLVTVACEESIVDTVQALCPCATCLPLPLHSPEQAWELLRESCQRADALAVGCGLGQSDEAFDVFKRLLGYLSAQSPLPAVIDADGLNLLSRLTDGEREAARPGLAHGVLTPHPAEAARLLNGELEFVLGQPLQGARLLRERYGGAVVLKGAASVLAAPEGMALNVFGTPAMAKGGSGDALTGVLAALLAGREAGAYAFTQLEALQLACALHGLAGLEAEKKHGQRGVLATDVCDCLGLV